MVTSSLLTDKLRVKKSEIFSAHTMLPNRLKHRLYGKISLRREVSPEDMYNYLSEYYKELYNTLTLDKKAVGESLVLAKDIGKICHFLENEKSNALMFIEESMLHIKVSNSLDD